MKSNTPELANFTRTMRGLLAVSKKELNKKLEAYECQKKRRKSKHTASRASTGQR